MSKAQHTELPWDFDGEDTAASEDWDGDSVEIFARDADGEIETPVGLILERSDAEFAVLACNSHYELLEALEEIANTWHSGEAKVIAQQALKKHRGDS